MKNFTYNEAWPIKKLGDVCNFKRGLTYSKNDEADFSNNVVLRANNINLKTNTLELSELKYLQESFRIPNDKKLVRGSIIICTASGSKSHLGKVALIDDDYDYAFGGFMGMLTPKKEINSRYLFYTLISDQYKQFIHNLSNGVNINNLKFDDLKTFEVPLPPLPIQQRLIKTLDKIFEETEKLEALYNRKSTNLEELKKSVLKKAFAGEL